MKHTLCQNNRVMPVLRTFCFAFVYAALASGAEQTNPPVRRTEEIIKGDASLPTNRENLHVFLLMGQSNMAGYGALEPGDEKPVPGVLKIPTVAKGEYVWQAAAHPLHNRGSTDRFGLGLPFAIQYRQAHPGVTVGLIPVAVGGAGIDSLKKGSRVYADAIAKARWALKAGVIKGVLWHQGESDTVTAASTDTYAAKLDALVNDLRADLESPKLPFVCGELALFGAVITATTVIIRFLTFRFRRKANRLTRMCSLTIRSFLRPNDAGIICPF